MFTPSHLFIHLLNIKIRHRIRKWQISVRFLPLFLKFIGLNTPVGLARAHISGKKKIFMHIKCHFLFLFKFNIF